MLGVVSDFRTPQPSRNDIVEAGCLGVTADFSKFRCGNAEAA